MGVSGHVNHIAVANALRAASEAGRLWAAPKLPPGSSGAKGARQVPVRFFQLISTSLVRKHLGAAPTNSQRLFQRPFAAAANRAGGNRLLYPAGTTQLTHL
jgi:hypothetical protein